MFVMRVFIAAIILIFSFQSLVKADDIRDFQIEGISVGDSLLDYFKEEEIKKAQKNSYDYSNKFIDFWVPAKIKNKNDYDRVSIVNKKYDSKYIIYGVTASKNLTNNFEICLQLKKEVVDELSSMFVNAKKKNTGKEKHPADKTGKSFAYSTIFYIGDGYVKIACFDFYDNNPDNWFDEFRVDIVTEEFGNFLKKHYK
jgi:hypothetical protein